MWQQMPATNYANSIIAERNYVVLPPTCDNRNHSV